MINMDNEKQYKVLLESYEKAYPDVLKQNQFKAVQREWNCKKLALGLWKVSTCSASESCQT